MSGCLSSSHVCFPERKCRIPLHIFSLHSYLFPLQRKRPLTTDVVQDTASSESPLHVLMSDDQLAKKRQKATTKYNFFKDVIFLLTFRISFIILTSKCKS